MAKYARGEDYHRVVRERLKTVVAELGPLERAFARASSNNAVRELQLRDLLEVLVLPRMAHRRVAARALARGFLTVAGMPLTVRFAERLPEGQCVVVCNHASYLDGIVLTAALPPQFTFVIKREMADFPLAGALLKRLGSQFVERFDRHRSAADARRVADILDIPFYVWDFADRFKEDVIDDFAPHIETEIKRRLEARMERLLGQYE